MSLLDLRIELPGYSHSFNIQVPSSSSILQVKQEIQRACPGAPRVEGQRVICRGRFLNNEEKVQDVWTSPDDSRVLHLAVHPSAWTESPPPSRPTRSQNGSPSNATPSQSPQIVYPPTSSMPPPQPGSQLTYRSLVPPPTGSPLAYIVHIHNKAVHVLTHGKLPPNTPEPSQLAAQRSIAISTLLSQGWYWLPIFDEEYPPCDESDVGVQYQRVIIENQPFLQLMTPEATPNALQVHALRVLTYTFPLLAIPSPDSSPAYTSSQTTPYTHAPITNLNQHLQQVGLPPLRVVPNANANQNPNDPNNPLAAAEIRAVPLHALMLPLVMLTFRTVLLLYFFSPSKRPLFGVLLIVWIIYEAWSIIRTIMGHGDQTAGAAAREGGVAPIVGQGPNAPRGPAPAAAAQAARTDRRSTLDVLLDKVSNINLVFEEAQLNAESRDISPPTLIHRAKTFISLLVTTLHPAVWDRRRTALRRREGRIRTEANLRESPPREEDDTSPESAQRTQSRLNMIAKHERRPRWIREYVRMVEETEFVDDA